MKSEVDEIQVKRNYIQKLESIQEQLNELYNFNEVGCIRAMWDPYKFTEALDIFVEQLDNEIEYQEQKLNDKEVIIYNKVKNN